MVTIRDHRVTILPRPLKSAIDKKKKRERPRDDVNRNDTLCPKTEAAFQMTFIRGHSLTIVKTAALAAEVSEE